MHLENSISGSYSVVNVQPLCSLVYNKNIGTVFRIQWKNSVVYDSGCKDCSKTHPQIPIDYACGWAISTDEGTYTLQMLLDKADSDMYENKQLCKKRNLGSRQ
mgnify:FL=1